MSYLFRTLIVQAQDVEDSRAIAVAFGPGGVGMWTCPLSESGNEPATHYISTGYIPAEFASLSPCTTWEEDEQGNWVEVNYYPGDADTVYSYTSQVGLQITKEEIEGIFLRSDTSEQQPFTAMNRMNLKIINPSGDF